MRAMVCGMLAPARPMEAARLAYLDGTVSHSAGGIYGGMYAAALTALAYVRDDPHEMLREALFYVPQGTEYHAVVSECLELMSHETSPEGRLPGWRVASSSTTGFMRTQTWRLTRWPCGTATGT